MNRRTFTKSLGLSIATFGVGGVRAIARKPAPQFSITMDDFNWRNAVKLTAAERNQAILDTLQQNPPKAQLFAPGRNIDADEGKQLPAPWTTAGHMIGNHTYSHHNLNAPDTNVQAYQQDILRAEDLLKGFSRFRKYFRF